MMKVLLSWVGLGFGNLEHKPPGRFPAEIPNLEHKPSGRFLNKNLPEGFKTKFSRTPKPSGRFTETSGKFPETFQQFP